MSDKLRGDVETEALNAATVAGASSKTRIALQPVPPTDDVMVLIGQVINQDVNLYDGSRACDPHRSVTCSSPACCRSARRLRAYRAIALDRLPSYIAEDRAGAFRYLSGRRGAGPGAGPPVCAQCAAGPAPAGNRTGNHRAQSRRLARRDPRHSARRIHRGVSGATCLRSRVAPHPRHARRLPPAGSTCELWRTPPTNCDGWSMTSTAWR